MKWLLAAVAIGFVGRESASEAETGTASPPQAQRHGRGYGFNLVDGAIVQRWEATTCMLQTNEGHNAVLAVLDAASITSETLRVIGSSLSRSIFTCGVRRPPRT